jgi:hypothetical protein
MKRVRQARKPRLLAQDPLEPKLVLPQENSDEHPLMQKYAKISQAALKNTPTDLEAESTDDPPTPVG